MAGVVPKSKTKNGNPADNMRNSKISQPVHQLKSSVPLAQYFHKHELQRRKRTFISLSDTKLTLTNELITKGFENLKNCTSYELDILQRVCQFQQNLVGEMVKCDKHQSKKSKVLYKFQRENFEWRWRLKLAKQQLPRWQGILQSRIPPLAPVSNPDQYKDWEALIQQHMSMQFERIQRHRLTIEDQELEMIRQLYRGLNIDEQHLYQHLYYHSAQRQQKQNHVYQWRQEEQPAQLQWKQQDDPQKEIRDAQKQQEDDQMQQDDPEKQQDDVQKHDSRDNNETATDNHESSA